MASFLLVLGSGEQKLITSQKNTLRIGRLPESEIFVDEPVVSRRHAEIYRSEADYFVQDAGSRNGTLLNGDRISQASRLSPGDVIGVGNSKVVFEPTDSVSFLKDRGAARPTSSISLTTSAPRQAMAPLVLLETVADIARQIVQDRPVEEIFDSILKACLDNTSAERAAIMILTDDGQLLPRAYLSRARSIAKFAISRTIAARAIEENEAILIKDIAGDDHISPSESIASLKIRSAICTPLWNGEKTVGVLYVDTTQPDKQFGQTDLLFFSSISGMIAEKIQNALLADIAREKQRLDAELAIATAIPIRLLPQAIPVIPGYEVSAVSRACTEVGGDYYDIIDLAGRVGLAIADVSGKGIGAAMLMSNLQAILSMRGKETDEPSTLLGRVNADLVGRVGEGRFVTFFYLILDPATGRMLFSNAGHNPPMMLSSSGEIQHLSAGGLPLGILEEAPYETAEAVIDNCNVLLLYSDGLTECVNRDDELFGEERLEKVLASSADKDAQGIRGAIFSAIDDFRQDEPYSDDMTLIVLKRL
jgi:serine phosphatase RsbU (regulator of sigma subunit)/pSer/pThr/pTyr-binding forkhead associated (FHA) protein